MTELELFKKALAQARYVPHPHLPMGPADFARTGLAFARANAEGTLGYFFSGVRWVHRLASELHTRDARYRHRASPDAFRAAVATQALDFYEQRESLKASDLNALKARVDSWFKNLESTEKKLIACMLIPEDALPFCIGPVRFVSAAHLAAEGIDLHSAGVELLYDFANRHHARWFALVSVTGEPERQTELANAAVDVALASLHLVLPEQVPMRRLSARARPIWSMEFSVDGSGGVLPGKSSNLDPGGAISGEYLDYAIASKRPLLDACGGKISALLAVAEPRDAMSLAWCDAAHWYYEAACDDLDTVALTKLEACLENLTSAAKRHSSGSRIRGLLQRVLGLSKSQPLGQDAPFTAGEFAEELVEARSRVLHGSGSTLTGHSRLTRAEVSAMARYLLVATSMLMEAYRVRSPGSELTVQAFQDWLEVQRSVENEA